MAMPAGLFVATCKVPDLLVMDATGMTGGRMAILTESTWEPLSVLTVTDLKSVPLLPARFTVIPILPLVPGAIIHGNGGNCAVVQPQDGCTLVIIILLDEVLVKLKVRCASGSPTSTVVAFVSLSQMRLVLEMASGTACGKD